MSPELVQARLRVSRPYFMLCLVLTSAACGEGGPSGSKSEADSGAHAGPPASAYIEPPDELSAWQLFEDPATQRPGPRTLPYEVIAPLFSDYAAKHRFIYLPEGKSIGYRERDVWQLPEGTVLIKTFSYPRDVRDQSAGEHLLETRLLVFTAKGVKPHTYVWNEQQTEARRIVAGTSIEATWINERGERMTHRFSVPNTNQCFDCHGKPAVANALALRTRQLDRESNYEDGPENQLDHMAALGWLDRAPEPAESRERLVDPDSDAPLSLRARSYLDANCSQCHRQGAEASASGMWLDFANTGPEQDPVVWGVCKRPTSAGGATCEREVDIVPGEPDRSIYMCRMESTDPEVQMPPLGRNLVHAEGVALLREWIASLPGSCE